jgi:LemA protein
MARYWWLVVLVLLLVFLGSGINTIPTLDEQVNASWAQVQNEYQRRMDSIPNLVNTVKGAANFEQKTLTDVVEARADASRITVTPETLNDPEAFKKFEAVQGQLGSALSHLMAVTENYPELKANQNFLDLQAQIEGTENRITVARRDYITAVQAYNVQVRTFPGRIWAIIYGSKPKPEFSSVTGADKPPTVSF